MIMVSKKAQSEVIGFILLTLIVIAAVSMTFFWAKPQIDKINNANEVSRVENRMIALHSAINEVANHKTQRTVSFEIKKGQLYLQNQSIIYSAYMDLPESMISSRKILKGNKSDTGPCVNYSVYGRVGYDDSGCLIEKGSIELELKYIVLNDTSENKCYGIMLDAGDNAAAAGGSHDILLTYKETNTTNYDACSSTSRPVVTFNIN